jgi:hypothetical protein
MSASPDNMMDLLSNPDMGLAMSGAQKGLADFVENSLFRE